MIDPFGGRSRRTHTVSRLCAAAAAALLLLSAAVACGPSHGGSPTAPGSGTASSPYAIWTPNAVVIPTGGLDPYVQCMVDAGWKIIAVHPGSPHPGYDMTYPGQPDSEAQARTQQCYALMPSPVWPSDDEVRAIYNRWVGEYNCLIGLGYQPDPPPSVETFVASYRTGPWDPSEGVAWDSWSQAQLSQAKAKCTLEMLPDSPNPEF
jgi:hypothetical protein